MKKILAILVAALMLLPLLAACTSNNNDPEPGGSTEPGQGTVAERPAGPASGTFTVAVNAMAPDFMWGWRNDIGVSEARDLIEAGASTIYFTRGAEFVVNERVVTDFNQEANDDGSKTFTMTIAEDLRWSDGEPITAADFAFYYLLFGAPAMDAMEVEEGEDPRPNLGNNHWVSMTEVEGFMAYFEEETDYISGIRLYDEFTFSVTIGAEDPITGNPNFPYFYELNFAATVPYPVHVIAPGLTIEDDGNGAFVSGDGLTYDLLVSTVDNGTSGFRYDYSVTAGAYMLISYDEAAYTAVLRVNPYFHGMPDGSMPLIETLILRQVDQAVMIQELQTGGVDLLQGVGIGSVINQAFSLVEAGGLDYRESPRNGAGGLFFHNVGPTRFVEVRRAIAWSLNREEFSAIWLQGHGNVINSRIAAAQWMFIENQEWVDENLPYHYTLNLENATQELVNGGWVLDADGNEWVSVEESGPRHKLVDGELMKLEIRWFAHTSNEVGSHLQSLMVENAESVGFVFDITEAEADADWAAALQGTSDEADRYNMVNGGMGIPPIDAVWFYYSPYFADTTWNWGGFSDPELFEYALARRNATSREEYLEAWKHFIIRYNEYLPALPLDSAIFHDFFTDNLRNYEPTSLWQWQRAIVYSWLDGESTFVPGDYVEDTAEDTAENGDE
ncbi:MAG: ABC transporter substrate-binding protein [Oscillospiraceae bacterium]|nr:ABC transporter substrate-binding protein [Oscillospiraceae bacterium]